MLCWQPRRRLSMDKVLHDPLFHPFLRPGDIVNEGPLDEQVNHLDVARQLVLRQDCGAKSFALKLPCSCLSV